MMAMSLKSAGRSFCMTAERDMPYFGAEMKEHDFL